MMRVPAQSVSRFAQVGEVLRPRMRNGDVCFLYSGDRLSQDARRR